MDDIAKQAARFRQDEDGVHYVAETYVHHITAEQFIRVLRNIRELHAAGRPFNRTNLIEGSGVHHTEVSLVLNWIKQCVTAWKKPILALWERLVAAQWLAIDDPEEVGAADVASVFGDPPPASG